MTIETTPHAGDANSADWNFLKIMREFDEVIQRNRAERAQRIEQQHAEVEAARAEIDQAEIEEATRQYVAEMERQVSLAAPAPEHQGHVGLALEAATLAGIRTVLTGAYAVTIVRGDICIQGYAKRGAGHIAKRLDLTRTPEKDHARLRYYAGTVGRVRVELVVDCDDPDTLAAGR